MTETKDVVSVRRGVLKNKSQNLLKVRLGINVCTTVVFGRDCSL